MEIFAPLTVFAVILINLVILLVLKSIRDHNKYVQKYPPISDEEFMARLPRGTSRDTALRIRAIISAQMGVPIENIHPETRFEDFL